MTTDLAKVDILRRCLVLEQAVAAHTSAVLAELAGLRATANALDQGSVIVDPPPPPGLYAEIGGIPADVQFYNGGDVSSLAPGNYLLPPSGNFTATKDVKANLYCQAGSANIIVPAGKQATLRGTVAGVTFDGQGKGGLAADDDNANAMVLVADGAKLHTVRFTLSQGVGCSIVGKGVKSWFCEFDHNGAHGRGGKSKGDGGRGSGYHEFKASIHDNNAVLRKANAGNKITRCLWWLVEGTNYRDECGPAQWLDNYNENCEFIDCVFRGGTNDKKGNDPDPAFRSELGLPGGVLIIRPVFIDLPGAALSIDESSNVRVIDPTFGKCRYAAEMRNMLRGDDATGKWKNGSVVDETKFTCRLFNVSIEGNVKVSPETGPVVASDAVAKGARPVTLSNNKLSFAPALTVKIPA